MQCSRLYSPELIRVSVLKVCVISTLAYYCDTAKSLQLCLTLCDPTDGSPQGSPVPGILQARTLEWLPFSMCNYFLLNGNVGFHSLLSPEVKREFEDQS